MQNREDIAKLHIEELIEVGDSFKIVVKGYSMLPLLGFGHDTITLRRTDSNENIDGRIAMFRGEHGRIVVHRVISVVDGVVTLRGDGNLYQCEKCPRNEIIGVLESVIRENHREVSCTTRWWHFREKLWLSMPVIVRRYALAIFRRLADLKRKK